MDRITPVVLCGGSGTRLWPRSRATAPKPFLNLVGGNTLFEATLARCNDDAIFAPPVVVTGKQHLGLVESQLPQGGNARVIVEPAARNTAPAIALAALTLPENAVMLICPSDHHIAAIAAFHLAAQGAAKLAAQGKLVAFGIAATRPETGYGYIRRGDVIEGGFAIGSFVEKPDRARAEQFLADDSYCWNGGIFAFRAGSFLEELARHRPAMVEAARAAITGGTKDGARIYPDAAHFSAITGESVDYAVMEETDRAAMVPASMGWSDIGTWAALREARAGEAGEDGNILRGPADVLDSSNIMVDSDGPRVSVVGLDDVIVVVDGGEVLVTSASGAANVGKLKGPQGQ